MFESGSDIVGDAQQYLVVPSVSMVREESVQGAGILEHTFRRKLRELGNHSYFGSRQRNNNRRSAGLAQRPSLPSELPSAS